jgi:hypothetical protein
MGDGRDGGGKKEKAAAAAASFVPGSLTAVNWQAQGKQGLKDTGQGAKPSGRFRSAAIACEVKLAEALSKYVAPLNIGLGFVDTRVARPCLTAARVAAERGRRRSPRRRPRMGRRRASQMQCARRCACRC